MILCGLCGKWFSPAVFHALSGQAGLAALIAIMKTSNFNCESLSSMAWSVFGGGEKKPGLFERLKEAVSRTRENLSERIDDAVGVSKEIDRSTLDDLEGTLLGADLGSATTHQVLEKLRERADRKQIKSVDDLKRLLKEELLAILRRRMCLRWNGRMGCRKWCWWWG